MEGSRRRRGCWKLSRDRLRYNAWLSSPAGVPGSVGLYIGAHDPESRLKYLPAVCLPGGGANSTMAGLRAVHLPDSFDDASTNDFELPYEVVVEAFSGDWWDAAQIYRSWALPNALWTRKGNLSARTDVPRWVLDAPVWLRLHSDDPSNETVAKFEGVRDLLGSDGSFRNMGLHWYSWNSEVFDSKRFRRADSPRRRVAADAAAATWIVRGVAAAPRQRRG